MYKSYIAVAPKPQDFPRLLDAMGEFMRQPYDWSASVKQLSMPVMLVYGDADMIRPEHIISFYHLLGGGLKDAGWMREHMSKARLAILPDLTHYEIGAAPIGDHRASIPEWGEDSGTAPNEGACWEMKRHRRSHGGVFYASCPSMT